MHRFFTEDSSCPICPCTFMSSLCLFSCLHPFFRLMNLFFEPYFLSSVASFGVCICKYLKVLSTCELFLNVKFAIRRRKLLLSGALKTSSPTLLCVLLRTSCCVGFSDIPCFVSGASSSADAYVRHLSVLAASARISVNASLDWAQDFCLSSEPFVHLLWMPLQSPTIFPPAVLLIRIVPLISGLTGFRSA